MVTITNDYNTADAITHNGVFHADDVMATAILAKLNDDLIIARRNDVPSDYTGIVYDIGAGEFDHHQTGGNGIRENGIPYASAGLIWKAFGKEVLKRKGILKLDEGVRTIDRELIETIDGFDNGKDFGNNYRTYDISRIIYSLNPTWMEEINTDDRFIKAVAYASEVLEREIEIVKGRQEAESLVQLSIENRKNGYIELNRYVPWKDYVVGNPEAKDVYYVLYPSDRGGFIIQTVPKDDDLMSQKKSFPMEWRGKKGEELEFVTGIQGAVYAHQSGFLLVAKTKKSAKRIINQAIKYE